MESKNRFFSSFALETNLCSRQKEFLEKFEEAETTSVYYSRKCVAEVEVQGIESSNAPSLRIFELKSSFKQGSSMLRLNRYDFRFQNRMKTVKVRCEWCFEIKSIDGLNNWKRPMKLRSWIVERQCSNQCRRDYEDNAGSEDQSIAGQSDCASIACAPKSVSLD